LPTYQLLKYFSGPLGKPLGILVSGVPFLLLVFWPFLERGPGRALRRRRWPVRIGIAAVLLALFFGILGHVSETTFQLGGRAYEVDMYGLPHVRPPAVPGDAGEHQAAPASQVNARDSDSQTG
jgi:quinol-cytochrome oxidoreductase complex cytochrome b subunit